MKILYVGPEMVTDKMEKISREYFPSLEIDSIKYKHYASAPGLIENYPEKADAILFGGKTPFKLYEKKAENKILCDYIPRHDTTLYRAMFEAVYLRKYDVSSLSIDTYDEKITRRLFNETGIAYQERQMYFAEQRYLEEDYEQYVLEFHRGNYEKNHVRCCMTGLEQVYYALRREGLPVVLCMPSEDTIRQSVNNLQMRVRAQKNSENQIVVVAVKMDMPSEYSLMKDDEYAYLSQRLKILDRLYHFNSRIEGVLVEQGRSEFMIFTTKKVIETETDNYKDIYLLDALRDVSVINTYIGIGYGATANDSKFNAYEGIKIAQRHGGQVAYVVLEGGDVIGPVGASQNGKRKENFDERFYQIARESSLSANTVYKIFSSITKDGKTEYTSKELAGICGVSVRTMDRIVLKLCDAGYCEVISEKLMSKYGRPSRILRFKPFLFF